LVEAGCQVLAFTADLGQPDEVEGVDAVAQRMAPCGVETVVVDLRAAMAAACFDVVQAQARYEGGSYWNTTGIGRFVTVFGLAKAMESKGVSVLAHGATGRGNDQMRFERYTNVLCPDMEVFAPWRDPGLLARFPGRKEMAAYLQGFGLEASEGPTKRYSTDANLAGLSHEAEDLESLDTPMTIVDPPGMGTWPMDATPRGKPEAVALRFQGGRCTHLNGRAVAAVEAMEQANALGGAHGLGLSHALENRIIGTKSRGVYEAPGMELLGRALAFLYEAVLDRRARALFLHLSGVVGDQVYDGRWFDPATRAAMLAITDLTRLATGTVGVHLYKGHVLFGSLDVEGGASLYNEADSSMEASEGLNPATCQGFAEVQAVEAKALAKGGHIRADTRGYGGWPVTTGDGGSCGDTAPSSNSTKRPRPGADSPASSAAQG
jgi:argininosuccinate synthase